MAVLAFPNRPLIALALVIERPILSLVAQALLFDRRQGWWSDRVPTSESQ
ncbi:MAG: hypothetical protein ACRERE_15610 [Candidatus Entotheonellia bacterium]